MLIAMIWEMTVASAAPVVPRAGKPARPKIMIGSSTQLSTAPISCVTM